LTFEDVRIGTFVEGNSWGATIARVIDVPGIVVLPRTVARLNSIPASDLDQLDFEDP